MSPDCSISSNGFIDLFSIDRFPRHCACRTGVLNALQGTCLARPLDIPPFLRRAGHTRAALRTITVQRPARRATTVRRQRARFMLRRVFRT